jgi:hypothetical protein
VTPRLVFRCRVCREEMEAAFAEMRGGLLYVICERGHSQFIGPGEARRVD